VEKIVIRKLDSHNFCLAEKLEEPVTTIIAGKEIVRNYKNIDKFYGTLYYALRGLFRFSKVKVPFIEEKLKSVNPASKEELYIDWMGIGTSEIEKKLSKRIGR